MLTLIKEFNESIAIKSDGRDLYTYEITGELVLEDYRRYKLYLRCGNKAMARAFIANNDEGAVAQVDAFVKSQIEIIMNAAQRIGGYSVGNDGSRN